MAHSPYTDSAVGFVGRNPGCTKFALANWLARRCHPSKLYYLVNTQIRLGNIVAIHQGNRYALYLPDQVPIDKRSEDERRSQLAHSP